jgi:hypothetical protein
MHARGAAFPDSPQVCYSPFEPMKRWMPVAIGALAVVAIGALVFRGTTSGPARSAKAPDAAAPASSLAARDGGAPSDDSNLAISRDASGWDLSDAAPSALPPGAPKNVRFGVVLFTYRGAEGAAASARPKDEALRLAHLVAEAAVSDFRGAVAKGDPGSMDDAGRMPRGVLEPSVEYVLFTLKSGQVSPPVDTPRGYWILRRID